MNLLEKILVAIKFDRTAHNILQMAAYLSRAYSSSIVLIHVVPVIQGSPFSMDILAYSATLKLRKAAKDLIEQGVESVDAKVVFGSAFDQIIEYAESCHANVIMLGSGEAEAHQKSLLGITAEKVMRKAFTPVWVVKSGTMASIKRILCPIDFSYASRRALINAIQLSRTFLAELSIFTVIEAFSHIYPYMPLPTEELQRCYERKQEEEFDNFLLDIDFSTIKWKSLIRVGKPHQQILLLAKEMQPDLLVMGSVGRTGLARILMGSVAQRVVREIPCSVITVKSGEEIPEIAGAR